METEEALKKKAEKAALLKRLLDIREYMQLIAIIRTTNELNNLIIDRLLYPTTDQKLRISFLQNKLKTMAQEEALKVETEQNKNKIKFKNLNEKTLETLIEFATVIPITISVKEDDFNDNNSIQRWLDKLESDKPFDYTNLGNLHHNLAELEKNQKYARRWYKASEIIYVAAQSIGPLAEVPFLHFAIHPIMNGLYGLSYIARGVSMQYDPALGDRVDTVRTTFDKLSMGTSILSTLSAISMLIPVTLPISLPIFLFSMLTSNILSTVSSVIDLVQAAKKPGAADTKSLKWRIAEKSSSTLFNLVGIVAACLLIAAFFTPVGWAAGGAALAFGLGTAATCLAVFGVQKFCEWRAKKAEKQEKTPIAEPNKPKNESAQKNQDTFEKKKEDKPAPAPTEKPPAKKSATLLLQFKKFIGLSEKQKGRAPEAQDSLDKQEPRQDNPAPKGKSEKKTHP